MAEPVEADSRETKGPRIRWRCTLAPRGEYDGIHCVAAAMWAVAAVTVPTSLLTLSVRYSSLFLILSYAFVCFDTVG